MVAVGGRASYFIFKGDGQEDETRWCGRGENGERKSERERGGKDGGNSGERK